jgi:tRNA(Arg) A34 adenosine deaminase TadA
MHKRDLYIEKARRVALRSGMTQKHGAVIVDATSDLIMSSGENYLTRFLNHRRSVHAEMHAYQLAKKNLRKGRNYDMYVVRIGPPSSQFEFKLSKPCPDCTDFLKNTLIKRIYYSVLSDSDTAAGGAVDDEDADDDD